MINFNLWVWSVFRKWFLPQSGQVDRAVALHLDPQGPTGKRPIGFPLAFGYFLSVEVRIDFAAHAKELPGIRKRTSLKNEIAWMQNSTWKSNVFIVSSSFLEMPFRMSFLQTQMKLDVPAIRFGSGRARRCCPGNCKKQAESSRLHPWKDKKHRRTRNCTTVWS